MLNERIEVGVVIARFQVENLTAAHTKLLDWVYKNHPKMIVFLGISPAILSRRDPLDFDTRRMMIQAKYPNADIIGIKDVGISNKQWSNKLDININERYPLAVVRLYGGRDSFASRYTGRYVAVDLTQAVPEQFAEMGDVSGTHEREETVFAGPRNTSDFRAGVIYAAYKQKPKAYSTVDIALVRRPAMNWDVASVTGQSEGWQVALGTREKSDILRFPGGFVDPTDVSLEAAVIRETKEETGLVLDHANYLGSYQVNDWRYPGPDRIITTFFLAHVVSESTVVAADDLGSVGWYDLDNSYVRDNMSTDHTLLLEKLEDYRNTYDGLGRRGINGKPEKA